MAMNPRLLRPLAAGGFSPKNLSGLSGWWDAADASTVTLSGADVTQWDDKSGIGNDLPGVSGNEPTYIADALNGRGGMDWGPTQGTATGFLKSTGISAYTVKDIYVVTDWDGGAASSEYTGIVAASGVLGLTNSGTTFYNVGFSRFSIDGAASSTNAAELFGPPAIVRGTLTAAQTDAVIAVGKWGGFTTRGWAGKIHEVIFYDRELSDAEDAKVRNYLAKKWGIYPNNPPAYADADVNAYINAVEAQDQAHLEDGVRDAINDFITGCKADGIWDAIKASCILAGARTLAGALVPLKGSAPTNVNFVSGDYDRELGPLGATGKYIDTNRNRQDDGQDDSHAALYVTVTTTSNFGRAAGVGDATGRTQLLRSGTAGETILAHGTTTDDVAATQLLNFVGVSRSASASYSYRVNGAAGTLSRASQSSPNLNWYVFNRNPTTTNFTGGRIAFYSIGESLDLADLDTRVTALITAIGNAI